jgi:para-nitrobenzyl esterase
MVSINRQSRSRLKQLLQLILLPCLALSCIASIIILAGCPANSIPRFRVAVEKDVVYGVGRVKAAPNSPDFTFKPLLLDAYLPAGSPDLKKTGFILVHGGSFAEGSKEKKEVVDFAQWFTQRGYAAFAINYRLIGDDPPAPDSWASTAATRAAHAAMVDVKAAVRFVRANADQWGIDPEQIILLGESAGAIAAVATAVTEPEAFSMDGTDLAIPEQNHPNVSPRVQGYIHFWGNADHVLGSVDPGDPPIMIVHGKDDDNIFTPFSAAERFHLLLEFRGIPHDFYQLDGEGHGPWDALVNLQGLKSLTLEFINERVLGLKDLDAAN